MCVDDRGGWKYRVDDRWMMDDQWQVIESCDTISIEVMG